MADPELLSEVTNTFYHDHKSLYSDVGSIRALLRKDLWVLVIILVFKAMDDIGVIMTPFGDVVTVTLVVNSYVLRSLTQGVG